MEKQNDNIKKHIEIADKFARMPSQNPKRVKAYLAPDVMLKALLNPDETLKKIIEPNPGINLTISDFGLYEALMSIEPGDIVNWDNLIMLMRNSEFIFSGLGLKMTDERRNHLRECALKGKV